MQKGCAIRWALPIRECRGFNWGYNRLIICLQIYKQFLIQPNIQLPLAEIPPVKTAVTDSLGYMGHFYIRLIIKVGNGAGDFQYAAVGTGGEIQTYHRHLEHGVGLLIKDTVLTQHLIGHLCVAVYARDILISCRLYLTGCQHSFPYFRGRLARFCRRQFAVLDICHFHLQIYSV